MRFTDTIVIESRDEQRDTLASWNMSLSARNLVQLGFDAIDDRPCEPLSAADSDWGEQDDGSVRPNMTLAEKLNGLMNCKTEGRGDA